MSPASNPRDSDRCSITIDQCHDLLSSRDRRYLLYSLSCFTTPLGLPRAAVYVTEWTKGVSADEVPDERLKIYLRLYHDHVPRLAEADVVTYHQEDDTLELGPHAAELEPELERRMAEELPSRHEQLFFGD